MHAVTRLIPRAAALLAVLTLAACNQPQLDDSVPPAPPPPPSAIPYAPPPPPMVETPLLGGPPAEPIRSQPLPPPPPVYVAPPVQVAQPEQPIVIAMAPIPNPPERGGVRTAPSQQTAAATPAPQPRASTPRAPSPRAAAPRPAPAPRAQAPAAPKAAAPKVTAPPVERAPAAPPKAAAPAPKPAPVQPKQAAPAPTAANGAPADMVRADPRLGQALLEDMQAGAKLDAPEGLSEGYRGIVVLTLPENLAARLKEEAKKLGLEAEAANAELQVILKGEGYEISPATALSAPLAAGQSPRFTWSVAEVNKAAGALSAEVRAILKGRGKPQTVDLAAIGATQPAAPAAAEKKSLFERPAWATRENFILFGPLVLILIAIFLLARWLSAGARAPTGGPSMSVRSPWTWAAAA